MVAVIGVVSQKGGVGKSTIARMIACEYARADWNVKLADMDASQGTSFQWHSRRIENQVEPEISVEMFKKVSTAIENSKNFDLIVFDGAPHSTLATLQIARASDIIILPTCTALDDLIPTLKLAQDLVKEGIDINKIKILLSRVGASDVELQETINYIKQTPFNLVSEVLYEKTIYRRASDLGRTVIESSNPSTSKKAALVMKEIAVFLNKKTLREAA